MNETDEKRRFPRAHVEIELGPSPSRPADASERIADLSLGGALVLTNEPLPPGSELDLNFRIPGRKDVMSLRALVLREVPYKDGAAMAVRFDAMGLQDQVTLGAYVSDRFWDEQLPDAEIAEEVEDDSPLPEGMSVASHEDIRAAAAAADQEHEQQEWAQEGFVVVHNDGSEVDTRKIQKELGGEFIVVDTKR